MLDEEDDEEWKVAVDIYAGHPMPALDLAFQLTVVKQCLQRGQKGIPDAVAHLEAGIQCLYLHTDFHALGQRLFQLTLAGGMKVEQQELIKKLQGKK